MLKKRLNIFVAGVMLFNCLNIMPASADTINMDNTIINTVNAIDPQNNVITKKPIGIIINREIVQPDVPPVIKNDRLLVPIRVISEKLGGTVQWLPDTRQVIVNDPQAGIDLSLTIDQQEAIVNGQKVVLDTPATIMNDRTLVPLRFISENFSRLVKWEGDSRTVRITSLKALKDVRFGNQDNYERIVLDLSKSANYQVEFEPYSKQIIVEIPDTENFVETPNFLSTSHITINNPLIKDAIVSEIDNKTLVHINLKYAIGDIQDSYLSDPERIVIDCNKVFEKIDTEMIAAGVKHTHIYRGQANGPLSIHALELDPDQAAWDIKRELATGNLIGRETVSVISQRTQAIAAINAGFFDPDGKPVGLVYENNKLYSEPINQWDSVIISGNGTVQIKNIQFKGGFITSDNTNYPVNGINRQRYTNEIVIYTPEFGNTTKTNAFGCEWVVQDNKIVSIGPDTGNNQIPANGYVISAHGNAIETLASLNVGDRIDLKWNFNPALNETDTFALNGGPRLIHNGQIVDAKTWEGVFLPDIIKGRAPRTAVGVTSQGTTLFVTVDGRQPAHSIGVTLTELANMMKEFDAQDAINLDGGGSTTMVINRTCVNSPSGGQERKVGDALIVVPR